VRIAEVGSTELPRLHGVSNLRAIPDGVRVLRTILAERRRTQSSQTATVASQSSPGEGEGVLLPSPEQVAPAAPEQFLRPPPGQVLAPEST
jgi:hypothetical protein